MKWLCEALESPELGQILYVQALNLNACQNRMNSSVDSGKGIVPAYVHINRDSAMFVVQRWSRMPQL